MKNVCKALWNVCGAIGAIITGSFILTAILMWRDGESFTKYMKDAFSFGYNWSDSKDDEEEA